MTNPNTPASQGVDDVKNAVGLASLGAKIAVAVITLAALGAFIGVTVTQHTHEAPAAEDGARAREEQRDGVADGYQPLTNSAGDHVYAEMFISDGTGVVTTPLDAGVFTAISGSPLLAGQTDGSGCITASATTGLFTVALRCGVGELNLRVCINRVASSSNVAGTTTGAWVVNGTALTTSVAPRLVKLETVDAGNIYSPAGCVDTIYDATAVGDTIGFEWANAGGGITATTREASFVVTKVFNK